MLYMRMLHPEKSVEYTTRDINERTIVVDPTSHANVYDHLLAP